MVLNIQLEPMNKRAILDVVCIINSMYMVVMLRTEFLLMLPDSSFRGNFNDDDQVV